MKTATQVNDEQFEEALLARMQPTGRDPFKVEAARIFDTTVDKVTPQQREYAKLTTHAARYSGRMPTLAALYGSAKQHR